MKLLSVALVAILSSTAYVSAQSACSPSPCGENTNCEVAASGAAICRCISGYNHLPGGNTIDGCPVRIQDEPAPSRPRPPVRRPPVRQRPQRPSRPQRPQGDPCQPNPCGANAECSVKGRSGTSLGRAVCSCPQNYEGDPYRNCVLNPCKQDPCGENALCEESGRQAICKCPRGFFGDPFVRCNDNPCGQDPCGANADCENRGGRAICKCRPNYEGDPFVNCVLNPCLTSPCGINADCERNGDRAICNCRDGYAGDPFVRCNRVPCFDDPCGPNSDCESRDNSAVCTCRPGYEGNAYDKFRGCELEPCSQDPCGTNAECTSRGRSAICKCPVGYSGDPYTNCVRDPCSTDPCGENAICEAQGNQAICKCPPQHTGDPYLSCRFDPCADATCGRNTECSPSGQRSICRCLRGFTGSPYSRAGCLNDPCAVNNPCGENAICENNGQRPTCSCPDGHAGDPYVRCVRGDCIANEDCNVDQACKDFRCVDPCSFSCGNGADCTPRNHVAICRCPRGRTGDPFQGCRAFTRSEICEKCGLNTECEVGPDDTPICKCLPDYIGDPLRECKRECESSFECSASEECQNFKCVPVCRDGVCGENALCEARNNRATCKCPPDFLGDGFTRCYTECTRHDDCSQNQACVKFKCRDPCFEPDPNVCGQGANCEVRNHKPICSCPRGFTGDPFQSCRAFTKADLCQPNPCGEGADCTPGNDRSGSDRPVCLCPKGTRGNPLQRCTRGECAHDGDCGSDRACYNFKCIDPCDDACGIEAQCKALNHGAICSCPAGYIGDPLSACRPSRNGGGGRKGVSSNRVIGLSGRFKRSLWEYFYLY